MSRWRARGLVARLYAFGLVQIAFALVAVPWLAHFLLRPPAMQSDPGRWPEYVAAIMGDHASDPLALRRDVDRVRDVLHANVTVYDAEHRVLATSVDPPVPLDVADAIRAPRPPPGVPGGLFGPPPMPPVAPRVLPLPGVSGGRIVIVPSFTRPSPARSPLLWVLALGLLGSAVLSFFLARSFAAPLERLGDTARAFGAGDFRVRTGLVRDDEFGSVAGAFDDMASRVERLIRAQKELLANVSHELRTPLARIRVALDLAAEGDTATARQSLGDIEKDLAELEQLVTDVLDNARLELRDDAEQPSLPVVHFATTDASEIVDLARARFERTHPRRRLVIDGADALGSISADAALLRRAIDNVLDNAAKYSEADQAVGLRLSREGESFVFEITDQGIGIDKNDLARVGTPFFRTDRSRARKTGGIGLGLSLARRIAEAHGGTLTVDSIPGEGTRVRIAVRC